MKSPAAYKPPEEYWQEIADIDKQLRVRSAYWGLSKKEHGAVTVKTTHKVAWDTGDAKLGKEAVWYEYRLSIGIGRLAVRAADMGLAILNDPDMRLLDVSQQPLSATIFHYGYDAPWARRLSHDLRVRHAFVSVFSGVSEEHADDIAAGVRKGYAAQDELGYTLPNEQDYELFIGQLRRGASGMFDIDPSPL